MFEQDYVMRLIKEMVRAILKLLFNIDTESPTVELLENKEEKETLENLLDLVDAGKINEAENYLYDEIEKNAEGNYEIALGFYDYLNNLPDSFLTENNYSREEVKEGIQNLAKLKGLAILGEDLEEF